MSLPAALIERFVRHLGEVLDEVTALAVLMDAGGDGREPLRALVHKIAGTAGAYGFPELGEHAWDVEQAIRANAPWAPDVADKTRALRASLTQASRADPP